jgi:hypothetical protein
LKVIFTPEAASALYLIADFVESKNTPGSGKRYALKFRKVIEKVAQPNVQYALCNHISLALLKFNCTHYNDWVIAFRIEDDQLVVYQIIHSSVLS